MDNLMLKCTNYCKINGKNWKLKKRGKEIKRMKRKCNCRTIWGTELQRSMPVLPVYTGQRKTVEPIKYMECFTESRDY